MEMTAPPETVANAVAPLPPPPVNPIAGAEAKPVPPPFTAMDVTPLVAVVPLQLQPLPAGGVIETTVVFVGIGSQRTAPVAPCVETFVNAWV